MRVTVKAFVNSTASYFPSTGISTAVVLTVAELPVEEEVVDTTAEK